MSAFSDKLAAKNEPLPQEQFEGVDEDEWVSIDAIISFSSSCTMLAYSCRARSGRPPRLWSSLPEKLLKENTQHLPFSAATQDILAFPTIGTRTPSCSILTGAFEWFSTDESAPLPMRCYYLTTSSFKWNQLFD